MSNTTATKRAAAKRTVAINVPLPETVHRKLRLKAVREDLTLAEAITAAVTAWTK